jgi:glucose-6-phosphate 1-dehydrogenase
VQNLSGSLTIVIFGATGNLYVHKLAKALYLLFLEGGFPLDFNIIAFARKDLSDNDFRIFTRESILRRNIAHTSKLDDFLEHVVYFKGDFTEKDDFTRLKDIVQNISPMGANAQVLLHIATASELYQKIFENIRTSGIYIACEQAKILIEKPFGKNEADATHLEGVLAAIFKKENIFHVDHYLAKETARTIYNFKWDKKDIKKIKVIFHESNIVGSRGASYDAVGAFRDVGQNHMLELLALAIMDKPDISDAKYTQHIQSARAEALSSLYIDTRDSGQKITPKITRAQYEGYTTESGVSSSSQTETFFRVFLGSRNPNFSGVLFELEGGKGLVDMHSDITTTTVAIEIYPKNQGNERTREKKELKIQPVPGTIYESYIKVYRDALAGEQENFPDIEEIISDWKLTDELLSKWKNIPLTIYKKGSKAEDII